MLWRIFGLLFLICLCSSHFLAQEPTATETSVKIVTEEVRLNVAAQSSTGRFDPTVTTDDLLVVEDGVPQKIESLRRVPASVLLLLDTGGNLYFAKNLATTRETAKTVVQNLNGTENIAVMRYNDKPQIISDWTTKREDSLLALDRKLYTGRSSRFTEAINAAVETFKSRAPENRHLVLVTDGLESIAYESEQERAWQSLLAANITVHVVSYTKLEDNQAQKIAQRAKAGKIKGMLVLVAGFLSPDIATARHREKVGQPRANSALTNAEIKGELSKEGNFRDSPHDQTPGNSPSLMEDTQTILTVETDNGWTETIRRKREAWRQSEMRLQNLATETGGAFELSEDLATMPNVGVAIAQTIGSQYVLTYVPKRQIAESPNAETRTIRVVARRAGLQIQARQKLLLRKNVRIAP